MYVASTAGAEDRAKERVNSAKLKRKVCKGCDTILRKLYEKRGYCARCGGPLTRNERPYRLKRGRSSGLDVEDAIMLNQSGKASQRGDYFYVPLLEHTLEDLGMRVSELSVASGMPENALGRYKRRMDTTSMERIGVIAGALGVSAGYLIGEKA